VHDIIYIDIRMNCMLASIQVGCLPFLLFQGVSGGPLAHLAAACGVRYLTSSQSYTLTVDTVSVATSLECQQFASYTASVNRCLACPQLHPLVSVMVCVLVISGQF
jgi:hypothetical protein